MNLPKTSSEQVLRRLWWLHPAWMFAAIVGGTMVAAWAQSDATYALYGTPKFVRAEHVALAAAAIVAFALGQQVAEATGSVPSKTNPAVHRLVRFAFWLTVVLTLFGYAVWLFVGIQNGFSLGTIWQFLVSDEPELSDSIRTEMFATIKGVTTCAQFGVAAVPLGLWLLFEHRERTVILPLGLILLLAAARAFMLSERLALIELVVAAVVVSVRLGVLGRHIAPSAQLGLKLAPLLGVAALLVTFGTFESFRSWRYYRNDFDSITSFTVLRISAYYATAHNNGALALEKQRPYPIPYATLHHVWSTPGLSTSSWGYAQVTGVDPKRRYEEMLERYGTPELNNEGGLFQPALDFGWAGYLIFWFGAGLVAGRLYRHYLVGTLTGLTLFPLVFLAILETPRFLYLSNTRAVPALLALLGTLWLTSFLSQVTTAPVGNLARA